MLSMKEIDDANQARSAAMDGLRQFFRFPFPGPFRHLIRKTVRAIKSRKVRGLIAEAKQQFADWQLDACLITVERVLRIVPTHKRALQLHATVLGHLGRVEEALEVAHRTIELYPADVPSRHRIRALGGQVPLASREAAVDCARKHGFNPAACVDCAYYLYDAELFADAVELCQLGLAAASKALESNHLTKAVSELKLQMAMALEADGDFERASQLFRELVPERHTGHSAAAGLARCLLHSSQPQQGELALRASNAGQLDPGRFVALSVALLQAQWKIKESYELYRMRPLSLAMAKAFGMPSRPEELNLLDPVNQRKKILVVSEGGPGDELRFSTLYGDLCNAAGHLTITCDPRLESAMHRNFPEVAFVPVPRFRREYLGDTSDRRSLPDALLYPCLSDNVLELGRAAGLTCSIVDTLADLRPDADAFLTSPSHLKPRPDLREKWRACLASSGKRKIGIAWRSILKSAARNRHYLAVDHLRPLECLADCEFWLLQPGATEEEIAALREFVDLRIPEDLDLLDDFEGQIALVSCLDAVISPFTTTGELGGVCGRPTILVSTSANTRWRRRDDGTDIWHSSAKVVIADARGKIGAIEDAVAILDGAGSTAVPVSN